MTKKEFSRLGLIFGCALFLGLPLGAAEEQGAAGGKAVRRPAAENAAESGNAGAERQEKRSAGADRTLMRVRRSAAELKAIYDVNGDGILDEKERAKMEADFDTAKRLQKYLRVKPLIDRLDTNHDMRIDAAEGEKFDEAVRSNGHQSRRNSRPDRGQGAKH